MEEKDNEPDFTCSVAGCSEPFLDKCQVNNCGDCYCEAHLKAGKCFASSEPTQRVSSTSLSHEDNDENENNVSNNESDDDGDISDENGTRMTVQSGGATTSEDQTIQSAAGTQNNKKLPDCCQFIEKSLKSYQKASSRTDTTGGVDGAPTTTKAHGLIELLVEHCGLNSDSIFIDFGSGMGMVTNHVLLRSGARVIGLENFGPRYVQSICGLKKHGAEVIITYTIYRKYISCLIISHTFTIIIFLLSIVSNRSHKDE